MRWVGLLVLALCLTMSLMLGRTRAAADSADFCVVSNMGYQQCGYLTLQMCQSAAAAQSGRCVIRSAPQAEGSRIHREPAPPVAPGSSSAWDHVDIAGSFERGQRMARERREAEERALYLSQQRSLDLERRRLENERLRQALAPPPATSDSASFGGILGAALQGREALSEETKLRCDPIRLREIDAFLAGDELLSTSLAASYRDCVAEPKALAK